MKFYSFNIALSINNFNIFKSLLLKICHSCVTFVELLVLCKKRGLRKVFTLEAAVDRVNWAISRRKNCNLFFIFQRFDIDASVGSDYN